MNEYQNGQEIYNTQQNKSVILKNKTPDGGWLAHDPTTQQQVYIPNTEIINPATWALKMPQQNPAGIVQAPKAMPGMQGMAAIVDEIFSLRTISLDMNELKENFLNYYNTWYGVKPTEQIIENYKKEQNITDPFIIGELEGALNGLKTASTQTYPVMLHLSVDLVATAAKALIDDPTCCTGFAFSNSPGYDLVVVGYENLIRATLKDAGVYIDFCKVSAIPDDNEYSFSKAAAKKAGKKITNKEALVLDAFIAEANMPTDDAYRVILSEDILSGIHTWSKNKSSWLEKELPIGQVEDAAPNGDSDNSANTELQNIYTGDAGTTNNVIKYFAPIAKNLSLNKR